MKKTKGSWGIRLQKIGLHDQGQMFICVMCGVFMFCSPLRTTDNKATGVHARAGPGQSCPVSPVPFLFSLEP